MTLPPRIRFVSSVWKFFHISSSARRLKHDFNLQQEIFQLEACVIHKQLDRRRCHCKLTTAKCCGDSCLLSVHIRKILATNVCFHASSSCLDIGWFGGCLCFFLSWRMKVKIRQWNGVASWLWVANDENCGICRMAFNGCCPECEYAKLKLAQWRVILFIKVVFSM